MTRTSGRPIALGILLGSLAAGAGAVPPPPETPEPRDALVVLAAPQGDESTAPRIRTGDVLFFWRSGDTSGMLRWPTELAEIETERAPHGTVTFVGRRKGEHMTWVMPDRPWQLRVRPPLQGETLRLFREASTHFSSDPDGAARSWLAAVAEEDRMGDGALATWLLGELGRAWAEATRWREADAAYEEAVRRADGFADGAAALWRDWGETWAWRHNWERAEHCYRQALALTRPGSLREARDLAQLAAIAANRGDLRAMEDLLRQALALRSHLAPGSVYLIQVIREESAGLGRQAQTNGNPEELASYLKQLRAVRDRLLAEAKALSPAQPPARSGSPAVAASPAAPASIAQDLASPQVRLAIARRILASEEKDHPGALATADRWQSVARLGLELDDPGNAEPALLHALDLYEKLAPGTLREAGALHDLGVLHRTAQRDGPALTFLCRGAGALARHGRVPEDDEKTGETLGAAAGAVTGDCVAALAADGRPEEAFAVQERSRVHGGEPALPPQLLRRLQSLEADRAKTLERLAGLSASRDRDEIDRLLAELRDLEARRDEIAGPLGLDALRAALPPRTLLVTWSFGNGDASLFLLRPAGAPGPGVQSFPLSPSPDLREDAAGLYRKLLGPADAAIETAERLVLLPGEELAAIPFADLLRGEARLGEQKEIETAASATAWARAKALSAVPRQQAEPVQRLPRQ